MEYVAQHLQKEALLQSDPHHRDQFARSAFNRFYYATFIPLSHSLASMNEKWIGMPHKDIPELLRGTLMRELKKGRSRAIRIGDHETEGLCAKAISSCYEVASILEAGYAVRVAADYKAEIRVDFTAGVDFKLSNVPVSSARQWSSRVTMYTDSISSAMRQLSVGI